VQTSKGAEFSVADAARAWPRLCELRQAGGVYRPAVGTVAADAVLDISGFAVSQVSPAGVVVGCHNVSWEAVDELARELGVCDVTA
jgi:hypothetical protein